MGQDLNLVFEKYCVVDGSPKTVLLSHSNADNKKVSRKKPKSRNQMLLTQNQEFTEISFNRYRSASCRSVPSIRLVANEAPRRGSVYQSSKELGRMNRIKENETEGRKKIALSRTKPAPFSLEVVESLCSSDEDNGSVTSSIKKENLSSRIPLNKSLSSKLEMPHSPTKTETESVKSTSPKTRFSRLEKCLTRSQSQSLTKVLWALRLKNRTQGMRDSQSLKKDSCSSIASSSSSPAHLSGSLKLRNKNGVSYFEFSVKNPHDVWVAKRWNTGDGFNWVYTFHTAQNRRKSNVSGRGSKDHRIKDFLISAQMQVSCYLCTEIINSEAFNNSMLTEFVLYNLARSRQSVSQTPDGLNPKEDSNEAVDQPKVNGQSNIHSLNPWPVADLHPDLESAAIVLQESKTDSGQLTPIEVSVVIPSGNHGLPSDESRQVEARWWV
ncbi:uncharacterized protein LOC143552262 [Bidens hawaiensis]|uniref:uncharacterized protein LOC143552262 n=1 Tax=Bidens hawaiensis TaxID=980011 RepID=UPI004049032B